MDQYKLPENVFDAIEKPEVASAIVAFMDRVKEATDGNILIVMSNYFDKQLYAATKYVFDKKKDNARGTCEELLDLYCEIVKALSPYQLPLDVIKAADAAPRDPWGEQRKLEGRVFYFLPNSGSYWIDNEKVARYKTMIHIILNTCDEWVGVWLLTCAIVIAGSISFAIYSRFSNVGLEMIYF